MTDQQLHSIVKEKLESIEPTFDEALWAKMETQISHMPSSGHTPSFWHSNKLLGWAYLSGVAVTGIAIGFLLSRQFPQKQQLERISASDKYKKAAFIHQEPISRTQYFSVWQHEGVQIPAFSALDFASIPAVSKSQTNPASKEKLRVANRSEIPVFDPSEHKKDVLVAMAFGKAPQVNQLGLPEKAVQKVTLVYSDFPKGGNFERLNQQRIEALLQANPEYFGNENIEWELLAQTACPNVVSASALWHGFLIEFEATEKEEIASTSEEKEANNASSEEITQETALDADALTENKAETENDATQELSASELIMEEINKGKVSKDSTTYRVLDRHKTKWKNTIVVCDWTSSMFSYGTQVAVWMDKNHPSETIDRYVFFNDCDENGFPVSSSGAAPAFYEAEATDKESVVNAMLLAARKGELNTDYEENDLAALWHAITEYPEKEEFILIADNKSDVRNPELLSKLKKSGKKFRVIVCGNHFEQEVAIQPIYWKLAKKTGGSIHTQTGDIEDFKKLRKGDRLKVGEKYFYYRAGKFKPKKDE